MEQHGIKSNHKYDQSEKVPQLWDEVVHKSGDESGTVVAKYPKQLDGKGPIVMCLDVRVGDKIRYGTPMRNWKTVMTEEQMNG